MGSVDENIYTSDSLTIRVILPKVQDSVFGDFGDFIIEEVFKICEKNSLPEKILTMNHIIIAF